MPTTNNTQKVKEEFYKWFEEVYGHKYELDFGGIVNNDLIPIRYINSDYTSKSSNRITKFSMNVGHFSQKRLKIIHYNFVSMGKYLVLDKRQFADANFHLELLKSKYGVKDEQSQKIKKS